MSPLENTVDLLRTLVRFDTTSARSNLDLIHFVRDYLKQYGIDASLTHDETGTKANLFATLGPANEPGICLSGHSDVVPVTGQNWTCNPFDLTERDGNLYGRGTADMKGYLAAMLASVPVFLESGSKIPFHLAISYDEEIGCVGVRKLLDVLARQSAVKPLACIIGEPTHMRLAVAHKGKRAWRCCVRGRAGHSALTHLGVNAAEYGAEMVVHLRRIGAELRTHGIQDDRFDPPYTTVHTGKLQSGIALNVIPEHCQIDFEVRHLPDDDPDAIFQRIQAFADTLSPEMRAVDQNTGFEWQALTAYPGLECIQEGEWLRKLAARLLASDEKHTLSFGTEGGLFQAIGIPSIVCGPGSMDQGHKADEFVSRSQLEDCLGFMRRLARTIASEGVRAS